MISQAQSPGASPRQFGVESHPQAPNPSAHETAAASAPDSVNVQEIMQSPREISAMERNSTPPSTPPRDSDRVRAPPPSTPMILSAGSSVASTPGTERGWGDPLTPNYNTRGLASVSTTPFRLYISDTWIAPDTPLHLKGQGGEARRLAAMHERGGQDLEAAAVVPTPQAVRVPASFWRPTESDNVIQHAPSMRLDPPATDCGTVCKTSIIQALTWVLVNIVGVFYWPPRCLYHAASLMAACSQEMTYCCDSPNPNVNSCDFCLRRLMTSEFYVLYLVFYVISYAFYAISMLPLHLLALISPEYEKEFRDSKFRISCCGIEDYGEHPSGARVRTAAVVPAVPIPTSQQSSIHADLEAQSGPRVVPASAVQVLPFSPP